MDRRTIIGFAIIILIVFGWSMYNQNIEAKNAAIAKRKNDSLARIEKARKAKTDSLDKVQRDSTAKAIASDTTHKNINTDSLNRALRLQSYGPLAAGMEGDNKPVVLENEEMRAEIYPRGGRVGSVTLKKYKTHAKKPLVLFQADSSSFGIEFQAAMGTTPAGTAAAIRPFNTDTLYFRAQDASPGHVTMRLDAGNGRYVEYVYAIGKDNMLTCKLNMVNMKTVFAPNTNYVTLKWGMTTPAQEQLVQNEQRYSTAGVLYTGEDKEYAHISEMKYEKMKLPGDVRWVAFKQQYFTSTLIADNNFDNNGELETRAVLNKNYVKHMAATMPIPLGGANTESFGMKFYFGPTEYKQLEATGLDLQKQIYTGWWIFGGLNRWAIMPLFNALESVIHNNMGLVILLLTIIVKIVIFPIAYRSYVSQAKMRVLKPEIDAMNERMKDADAMQKQQAQMALYRKAGINPAAGCIPLLLQLPILFALINFFPIAFDLRQQSFLWCPDLSSYDSILDLGFSIPLYGDHVSLWALLMTASTLVYTWMNSQAMNTSAGLPGMKVMMYVMPVFFLVFLNNYSAALSFYYFVANMINITQMMLMRRFVDEAKIRSLIETNKKKPAKQGRMSAYLEKMQKQQQDRMKQIQQQKKK